MPKCTSTTEKGKRCKNVGHGSALKCKLHRSALSFRFAKSKSRKPVKRQVLRKVPPKRAPAKRTPPKRAPAKRTSSKRAPAKSVIKSKGRRTSRPASRAPQYVTPLYPTSRAPQLSQPWLHQ